METNPPGRRAMARRRRILRRLDLMVFGASPEKLAAQQDIPAIIGPNLTTEQADRLYRLNYRSQHAVTPLSAEEEIEREKLRIQLINPRRF